MKKPRVTNYQNLLGLMYKKIPHSTMSQEIQSQFKI